MFAPVEHVGPLSDKFHVTCKKIPSTFPFFLFLGTVICLYLTLQEPPTNVREDLHPRQTIQWAAHLPNPQATKSQSSMRNQQGGKVRIEELTRNRVSILGDGQVHRTLI